MKGKLFRPTLVALVIVGALLVAGGIAYATIPDSSGVIHACYKVDPKGNLDGNATLRVIDPSATKPDSAACKKDEQALDWNQQGVQGPPGATGPSDVWSVDGCCAKVKGLPFKRRRIWRRRRGFPTGATSSRPRLKPRTPPSIVSNDYFCDLVDSSNHVYQDTRVTSSDWVTIPVQAVITLTSPDTISLQCEVANTGRCRGLQLAAGRDQDRDGALMRYARNTLCGSLPFSLSPAVAQRSPRRAPPPRPRRSSPASGTVTTAAPSPVTSRFTGRRPARGCTGTSRSRIRRARTESAAA